MSNEASPTILVIDDEATIRKALRNALEDADYDVLEAENGKIGLDVFDREKPDLVMVDLRMPVMSGMEVVAEIHKTSPDTPVIVVSGARLIGDAIDALRLGAWDFITKPLRELSVLYHAVDKALERSRLLKDNRAYQDNLEELVEVRTADLEAANVELKREITERKLTEGEIEKQTYYLTKAQEIGKIGTWELDLIKNVLIWTDENYRVFGIPLGAKLDYEVFVGQIHPDNREYVDREWKAAIEGKPYDIEHRLMIDGKVKWVREKAEVQFDKDGRAVTAIGFMQDINERKKAEEDNVRLSRAIEQADETIVITDAEGTIQFVNPAFEKTSGYTVKEAIGQNPRLLKSGQHDDAFYKRLWKTLSSGKDWRGEITNRKKDGTLYTEYNTISPVFDTQGRIVNYVAAKNDITERKRAEEVLKESLERLKGFDQHSTEGVFRVDITKPAPIDLPRQELVAWINEHAVIGEVNGSLARMYGYEPKDMLGQLAVSVAPNYGERAALVLEREGHRVIDEETEDVDKDGQALYLIENYHGIVEDGHLVAIWGAQSNITERKRAKDMLQLAVEGTSAKTGEEFFQTLVQFLSEALGMEYAFIGELLPDDRDRVQTLAVWAGDKIAANLVYDLTGTPCHGVISKEACLYASGIQALFPDDHMLRDMKAESYLGTPLFDSAGKPLGVLVVMDTKPFSDELQEAAGNLLSILGVRAAAEIERVRTDRVLIERDYILRESQRVAALGSYDLEIATGTWTSSEVLNTLFGLDADFRKNIESWSQIIHPEHREEMVTYFAEEVLGKHDRFDREYRIVRQNDGEPRWVHGLGRLEFDTDGAPIRMIGTIQDITERKLTEVTLQESEERFRSIIENTDVGYFFIDREGIIRDVNAAWAKMYKYPSSDEIIGEHFAVIQKADDVEQAKEFVAGIMAGDTRFLDGEFSRKCKDDSIGYHSFSAKPVSRSGEVVGIEGFIIDTTERKRAEEALQASEAKFSSIVQGSPMGMHMYRLEPDNRLIFTGANPAADTIVGVDHRQFIGKPIEEAFPPLADTEIPEAYRLVAREGKHWTTEQVEYEHDRIMGGFEVHAFQTAPGKVAVMFLDITERKNAEREREKLIADLEVKNAELERFAYTVSHDLKGPLITITGFAGLLATHAAEGDQRSVSDDSDRIVRAADKMAGLLDSLLDLSRVGRVVNPIETICMDDLVREAIEQTSGRAGEANVEVTIRPGLPNILGDRPRMLEVLQNLLDNAFKYIGRQTSPRVEVGYRQRGDEIQFYIADNGIGIDQQYHQKVFGLFDQLDLESEGAGVGLALVKRIVENHSGHVWVESDGDHLGSTFYFTVPSLQPHPVHREVARVP